MARSNRKTKQKRERQPWFDDLSPQAKQAIGSIVILVLAIFFVFSLLESAGQLGAYTETGLRWLFGTGAWLAPIACGLYMYVLLNPREDEHVSASKVVGATLLFIALLASFELYGDSLGGMVGWLLAAPLTYLFGDLVSNVLTGALLLIGFFLLFNTGLRMPWRRRVEGEAYDEEDDLSDLDIPELPEEDVSAADEAAAEGEAEDATPAVSGAFSKLGKSLTKPKLTDIVVKNFSGTYVAPPLSLLKKERGRAQIGDVKANANAIKRTLRDFGISVEMDAVESGPTFTRYALKPAQGVRIARIAGLQQELQLALKATSAIRIEAPIPGKSLVGIEVPNEARATVGLATLLSTPEYTDSPHPLLVALGKDVTGHVHFSNLARMPHGLIAGTTGSGKSVMIHNVIASLLFRNSPDQLRFILVDPKRVELTLYNKIPHLLSPVITEPKKAIRALSWAVKEMERRYDVLQAEGKQNINSYHDTVYKPAKEAWEAAGADEEEREQLPEPLPYIVIILDELNDLMQAYPKELEACIVRLAQMSRAVGIHLILATQRPSVNVITGTIKANIPTRIAFAVASQVDSRTIIDNIGAEKLLGQGDMLYLSSDSPRPIRLQSAFVSEDEIKKMVDYLKNQEAEALDTLDLEGQHEHGESSVIGIIGGDEDNEEDELYGAAVQAVREAKKASTSYLQRKLRIGYSRAARLMDLLEENSVIGPADGAKPREVLPPIDGGGEPADEDDYGEPTERL